MSVTPCLRLATAVVLVATAVPLSTEAQRSTRRGTADMPLFALPVRKPAVAPAEPPPVLPIEAFTLPPLTLEVQTADSDRATAPRRHSVTRTSNRVHVRVSAEREWLYARNPTDPRRVSGFLIDHPGRTIRTYEESDLRNGFGIRGWLDVLTLGFDRDSLADMTATGETRTVDGLTFVRHDAISRGGDGTIVWWNQAELLPLEVFKRSGAASLHVTIERVRRGVDLAVLEVPASRFPTYRSIDYPDWLEGLHER